MIDIVMMWSILIDCKYMSSTEYTIYIGPVVILMRMILIDVRSIMRFRY